MTRTCGLFEWSTPNAPPCSVLRAAVRAASRPPNQSQDGTSARLDRAPMRVHVGTIHLLRSR